nr:MAG TPA: hypothetical protein [Caudoviricetes sp.]
MKKPIFALLRGVKSLNSQECFFAFSPIFIPIFKIFFQ